MGLHVGDKVTKQSNGMMDTGVRRGTPDERDSSSPLRTDDIFLKRDGSWTVGTEMCVITDVIK